MNGTPAPDAHDLLRMNMEAAIRQANLSDPDTDRVFGGSTRKRARRDPRAGSRLATAALVQDDGILRWEYDPPPVSSRRRARRGGLSSDPDVVHGFQFLEVPPNEFTAKLEDLDRRLTPQRHLRRWVRGDGTEIKKAAFGGSVLLFVHGTFSKGDMFIEEFNAAAAPKGPSFLDKCEKKYDAVLTFDHPTLSVGPWLNALDLAMAMRDVKGPIDVVCHSRGGLVVAWWLFHAAPKVRRIVFVGSPLEGTSLAAPARLRAALDLLGNMARALGTAANASATAVPMLAIAGGLFKLLGGILSFGGSSPLLDAGVNLVPGLVSQSRVQNNLELQRLFAQDWAKKLDLYAVLSDYEPTGSPEPWWKFWNHFRSIPGRVADSAADTIFEGPNDLVVDTASMTQLGASSIPAANRLDLTGPQSPHHCSYFRDQRAVDFLTTVLGV
jgi:pimeloyl-ACP methyl ester carboxylesterase